MSVELPAALSVALAGALEGVSRRDLSLRAARTSAAYRAGRGSAGVIRGADDALAYALTRLPATYAACASVFAEAARRAPDFAPRSLLDAGSGTGAASWAAVQAWPGLERLAWFDENPSFLDFARRLAEGGASPLAHAERLRGDLAAGPLPAADLVVASYALAELSPERQAQALAGLWAAAEGMLALVEPGTPAGFARLRQARTRLLGEGAEILAPCPHAADCPMAREDWCHFSVRLPRSRDHRRAKSAELAYEDEPFAYLLAARPGIGARAAARVLARPHAGKPGVDLKLCTPAGLERRFVARRDKPAHAKARRLDWGDAAGEP
jgi:ribosomal protein RSM22 (predicted rRNA methylase)